MWIGSETYVWKEKQLTSHDDAFPEAQQDEEKMHLNKGLRDHFARP